MAFNLKTNQDATESKEARLTRMFAEMNSANDKGKAEKVVCETECTMARIRSLSDFLYLMRVKPIQTLCYYLACGFLLLAIAAFFCSIGFLIGDAPREVWYLVVIFTVLFLICATLPHNLRIQYFNKQADSMEKSFGKIINARFEDDIITLSVSKVIPQEQELDEEGNAVARKSALAKDDASTVVTEIPYDKITVAYECSHSFYLFPVDKDNKKMDTIICDKTRMLRGTPMELRDRLARNCGRKFRIKSKKM